MTFLKGWLLFEVQTNTPHPQTHHTPTHPHNHTHTYTYIASYYSTVLGKHNLSHTPSWEASPTLFSSSIVASISSIVFMKSDVLDVQTVTHTINTENERRDKKRAKSKEIERRKQREGERESGPTILHLLRDAFWSGFNLDPLLLLDIKQNNSK